MKGQARQSSVNKDTTNVQVSNVNTDKINGNLVTLNPNLIRIDDELKQLIPSQTQHEYELMKESIQEEGLRDPLILWKKTLVDGHHRLLIIPSLVLRSPPSAVKPPLRISQI